MAGEIVVPGDKIASVHLLLAALASEGRTRIKNIHLCGDVTRILNWVGSNSVADVDFTDNALTIEPDFTNKHPVDLSELGDTRSNICLVTAQSIRHGRTVFKGTGGCNFTERKIDRHFDLMRTFGVRIETKADQYIATLAEQPEEVNFGCSTQKYGPSVGVTCHALIASLAYDKPITLHNCALEPAVITLARYVELATNKKINIVDRTITIGRAKSKSHKNPELDLPPDFTAAFTYIACLLAAGGKIKLKEIGNLPEFLARLLKTIGVDFEGSVEGTRFSVNKSDIIHPGEIICDVWPGFPSDMGPLLSAALAGCRGNSVIIDNVYDKRSAHVTGLNLMGYKLETRGNGVSIEGTASDNSEVVTVEATDIRSGAALLVGALGRSAKTIIKNYPQIQRGYSSLVRDLRTAGVKIDSR